MKLSKRLLTVACAGLCMTSPLLAQINLSAETSSPGNSPYVSIIHLAETASSKGIASLQVQEGQTLTNAAVNVAEGTTDVAALPLILAFLLNAGRGPFAAQGEDGTALAANLRALYPYNAGAYGLLALDSAGIDSWDDLAGKRVFNGPPRGAALVNARQAIEMAAGLKDGEHYNGVQANWGQLATLATDGSVDALVVPITFPSDRVATLQGAGNVVIVSTPKDVFESDAYQNVFRAPGNVPVVLSWEDMGYGGNSGVRMVSEDATFRGIGTAFADVVNKDMPFDIAKALTAAYIEDMDRLRAKVPYGNTIGVGVLDPESSGFCGANPLKYHPGAVAAWEEAGYDVPDCAQE